MYFADATRLIRVKLAGAVTTNQLPIVGAYQDITVATWVAAAGTPIHTVTNSTTAVTVADSPAAGTLRVLKSLAIHNADTAAATVTVEAYDSSNARTIVKALLAVGDNLAYDSGHGWITLDASGNVKQQLVAHTLLNSTLHTDTTTAGVSRGDLVTGQGASPTWSRLAIGAAAKSVMSDGTDVSWDYVVQVNLYTSSNTWTKPSQAKWALVLAVGGGGGGGSGCRDAAGTDRAGGSGGSPGQGATGFFYADLLGATETVTVGAGGPGGNAVTADTTNGNNGTAGGTSSFGSWVSAGGGDKGNGGAGSSVAGATQTSGSSLGGWSGAWGSGGVGGFYNGVTDSCTAGTSGGGGSGGGVTNGNNVVSGANGGAGTWAAAASGGGASTNGSAGGNGYNYLPGGGGGGGGSKTAAAGAGGSGGLYGGGGGGGGGVLNGFNSGAGGTGGSGAVLVITLRG